MPIRVYKCSRCDAEGHNRSNRRCPLYPVPEPDPVPVPVPSYYLNAGMMDCPICLEEKTSLDFCLTNCSHKFCLDCMVSHLSSKIIPSNRCCPMCRTIITSLDLLTSSMSRFAKFGKANVQPEELL